MQRIVQQVVRMGARIEAKVVRFAGRHDVLILRLSLGTVFLWFALPKFVPGLSAMESLGRDTITALTAGVITGDTARLLLATLEAAIAVGLLSGRFLRITLIALLLQMMGTLTPLALFPQLVWKAPFVLTLEGQFIVKNLVLVAAGIGIAGRLHSEHGRTSGSVESLPTPHGTPAGATA